MIIPFLLPPDSARLHLVLGSEWRTPVPARDLAEFVSNPVLEDQRPVVVTSLWVRILPFLRHDSWCWRRSGMDENDHPKGALLLIVVYLVILGVLWTNALLYRWRG